MKITIKSDDYNFTIPLPNFLINEHILAWAFKQGKKYDPDMQNIPIHQLKALVKELKKSVKTFGHYELVHVESSDGDIVIIEL